MIHAFASAIARGAASLGERRRQAAADVGRAHGTECAVAPGARAAVAGAAASRRCGADRTQAMARVGLLEHRAVGGQDRGR